MLKNKIRKKYQLKICQSKKKLQSKERESNMLGNKLKNDEIV